MEIMILKFNLNSPPLTPYKLYNCCENLLIGNPLQSVAPRTLATCEGQIRAERHGHEELQVLTR